jgi:hypothetical protein
VFPVSFARDDLRASFITTATMFSWPTSAAVDEMRIESWFPADAETDALCRRLAGG